MKRGIIRADRGYLRKEAVDDRVFSAFVEHAGNVIYNGIYQPEHPLANADGFREDVIQLVKELHLAGIRYPGGNFICSYRWEDTVGPVEERPVRADLAWRQREPNIVGLAEFEKWETEVVRFRILFCDCQCRLDHIAQLVIPVLVVEYHVDRGCGTGRFLRPGLFAARRRCGQQQHKKCFVSFHDAKYLESCRRRDSNPQPH